MLKEAESAKENIDNAKQILKFKRQRIMELLKSINQTWSQRVKKQLKIIDLLLQKNNLIRLLLIKSKEEERQMTIKKS